MADRTRDVPIDQLSPHENVQVFQRLARDLTQSWPGVEHTLRIQGGDAWSIRTRIPVWPLKRYRRLGWNDDRLLARYPTLRARDVVYA